MNTKITKALLRLILVLLLNISAFSQDTYQNYKSYFYCEDEKLMLFYTNKPEDTGFLFKYQLVELKTSFVLWDFGGKNISDESTYPLVKKNCNISPNGLYLVNYGSIYEIKTNRVIHKLNGTGPKFSDDGFIVYYSHQFYNEAIGKNEIVLKKIDIRTGVEKVITSENEVKWYNSLAVSKDGKYLVLLNKWGTRKKFDVIDSKTLKKIKTVKFSDYNNNLKYIYFTDDTKYLVFDFECYYEFFSVPDFQKSIIGQDRSTTRDTLIKGEKYYKFPKDGDKTKGYHLVGNKTRVTRIYFDSNANITGDQNYSLCFTWYEINGKRPEWISFTSDGQYDMSSDAQQFIDKKSEVLPLTLIKYENGIDKKVFNNESYSRFTKIKDSVFFAHKKELEEDIAQIRKSEAETAAWYEKLNKMYDEDKKQKEKMKESEKLGPSHVFDQTVEVKSLNTSGTYSGYWLRIKFQCYFTNLDMGPILGSKKKAHILSLKTIAFQYDRDPGLYPKSSGWVELPVPEDMVAITNYLATEAVLETTVQGKKLRIDNLGNLGYDYVLQLK